MLGMGCPHPSFHNSYPVANHDIPNPPIVTEEGFAAAGYRQYDRIIPEDLWATLAELATVELNPSMLEEVDLQAPGEGGGRYQTTVSSVPHWLPDDLWQAVLALLGFSLPPLQGLEALCPKIIERWEAEPWKGFQIPHRDFALSVKQSVQCMVVFIPLTTSPPSKSLQVCLGTQGGYHAAHRWDIVIQPLRIVTLLRGTVIHRGAGGPGQASFIPFAPVGYRSRMLTVEPESVTELMNSVPVMPSELLAEGAAVGSPLCPNSWDICIPTHPFVHCMPTFWSFGSLPRESSVPDSLLRFCLQGGFFTVFFLRISSAVHCATHVPVLQCLPAIVINS